MDLLPVKFIICFEENTGWAVSRAPKNLKQIKGKLKLKINFDWNQPNLKVLVTDTVKKKKGCFIPLFLHSFRHTTRKSLVRDLRPTLYYNLYKFTVKNCNFTTSYFTNVTLEATKTKK